MLKPQSVVERARNAGKITETPSLPSVSTHDNFKSVVKSSECYLNETTINRGSHKFGNLN